MKYKIFVLFFPMLLLAIANNCYSQAQIVLNGAYINITNSAYLVIDNPASNAITRNSGHIISEGENNRVKWNIGTTAGTYTVPFGYSNTNYIPVTYTKNAGAGSGSFVFSTYRTPTWQNSLNLPTSVSNMYSRTGTDNSAFVIDRFWQINAGGYTTRPDLSNLIFTYIGAEWSAAGNTITEANLKAQRWNSTLGGWGDYNPTGTDAGGTVTVSTVAAADFFEWWTLTDSISPLPIELLSFDGKCNNGKIELTWSTASEINNNYFTIERSNDAMNWKDIATIAGAGTSTHVNNYIAADESALNGINYYKLKQTDYDGRFSYSSIIPVTQCDVRAYSAIVFPNPSDGKTGILIHSDAAQSSLLRIYNGFGQIVYTEQIPAKQENFLQINTSGFAEGLYTVALDSYNNSAHEKLIVRH